MNLLADVDDEKMIMMMLWPCAMLSAVGSDAQFIGTVHWRVV